MCATREEAYISVVVSWTEDGNAGLPRLLLTTGAMGNRVSSRSNVRRDNTGVTSVDIHFFSTPDFPKEEANGMHEGRRLQWQIKPDTTAFDMRYHVVATALVVI